MATRRLTRPRRGQRRFTHHNLESLEPRNLLAAVPIINEFMAVNQSTIQDEDGDYSDWIEVVNAGDQRAELGGYWLTDRTDDLTGWRFPDVGLDPGQTLLVFASGKDRDEPAEELHTNFRLSSAGEYLALVAPDGTTVLHEFAPEYPPQVADVSYGLSPDQISQTLLPAGATGRYFVPTDDSLQDTWTHLVFNDSSWASGAAGIGYETGVAEEPPMVSAIKSLLPRGYWRFEETGGASTAVNQGTDGISRDGTYNGAVDRNASGPGSGDTMYGFDDSNSAVAFTGGAGQGVSTSTGLLSNRGEFSMVGMIKPGTLSSSRIGLFGQNDAVEFGFSDPNTLQVWTPNGGSLDVDYSLPADEWHHVAVVGDGQSLKIYLDGQLTGQGGSATNSYGSSNFSFNIGGGGVFDAQGNEFTGSIDEVAVFDRALTVDEIGSMLGGQNGNVDLAGQIATDIQDQLYQQNSSLYVRMPFQVDDPTKLTRLALNLQVDDGIVAYVNGIEVTRLLAPGEDDVLLPYNATATNSRPDSDAVQPLEIEISEIRDALRVGENVLAVQVLNLSADDPDLLFRPELVAAIASVDLSTAGYLTTPTPDDANHSVSSDLGPLVVDVNHTPNEPLATDPVVVTAEVAPTLRNVASVDLVYRVMYGAETTIAMNDDGTGGDATGGDGVYTAIIPANIAQPGEMLRWYVRALDDNQVAGRLPQFDVQSGRDRTPEYLGTLVADPAITSEIPILHWWVEDDRRAGTRSGTHGSLYYNGEFYDSVFMRQRGGSTANNPVGKTNFKFDFVQEQFRFDPNEARVEEFNLNSTATDKAYIRQSLSFEAHNAIGAPASISFPVHVRRNDEFYGVFTFIEEPDDEMLERVGLDQNGALYKVYNEFTSASSVRKKTRDGEDNSDLATFITDVRTLDGDELHNYLIDNVNLPATLNYLVATVLTHQNDNPHKNHYLYRDTEGTGEWLFIPWDHDLTWGSNWVGTSFSDQIYADMDDITEGPVPGHDPAVIHPSHPFINSEPYREWNNHWNRLMDALLQDDVVRQMFLRRLRTGMDQLFGQPGTADSWVDQRLNNALATMVPDTNLDKDLWANPRWRWGEDQSFTEAIEIIRNEYLEVRRQHLYVTHSVDNLEPEEITVLIPEYTMSRYFVPTDDSLGTSWTELGFDDSGWSQGETGLGFENTPRNFVDLVRTEVKPADHSEDGTSFFMRIPFDIADPSQVDALTLRMKYDDGFVAYINGQRVTDANLREDDPQGYSSRARPNANPTRFQNFVISEHVDQLVAGQNILAIHGLNSSASSSDMLMLPELIDGVISTVEIAGIPHSQVDNPPISIDQRDFDVSPVSGNQDEEYVRLNNPTDQAVDISGWRLTGGIEHTFHEGTIIPAGMSLFVSPSVPAFRARATGPTGGQGLLVQGDYRGHLSNLGETVLLVAGDGELLSTLTIPANPSDVQRLLRVTEINYNPTSLDEATEFVELTNISNSETLDLSGVTWVEGPQQPYTFTTGVQLGPRQSLVIAKDPGAFQANYPGVPANSVFGPFVGNLSNQGETIKLDDAQGNTVVEFEYSDGSVWPQAADGVGSTLVLADLLTPTDQLSKYYSWRSSRVAGGTPAATAEAPLGVVINEVVSNPAQGQTDAVELKNVSGAAVDLGGWWLSNSTNDFRKFQFAAGTTLAAGGYLIVSGQQLGFDLDGTGDDDLWLVTTDANGAPTSFGDDVQFAASVVGESWGRIPDGSGRLGPLQTPTLGAANDNPRVGPVVISEVQYHPARPSEGDPDDLEFVEITNTAGTPLDLTGWRIRGGVDMDFDDRTTLGVNESLIVISFNPTSPENAGRLAAFRAEYGLNDTARIVGGYGGQLSDSYDRIQLQRPGGTEADPNASEPLWVDEVLYDDLPPWASAADGSGATLQRVDRDRYGNLAGSWYAAAPNPGRSSFGNAPGDFNGDGVVDAVDINLLFAETRSDTPDIAFDLTGDGNVDLADRDEMILTAVGTTFGDANLDRIYDSNDLVQVLAAGQYEDGIPLNSGWAEGDWDADGDFTSADFVLSLARGGYVAAAHPTAAANRSLVAVAAARIGEHAGGVKAPQSNGTTGVTGDFVEIYGGQRRRRDIEIGAVDSIFGLHESSAMENTQSDEAPLDPAQGNRSDAFPFV